METLQITESVDLGTKTVSTTPKGKANGNAQSYRIIIFSHDKPEDINYLRLPSEKANNLQN